MNKENLVAVTVVAIAACAFGAEPVAEASYQGNAMRLYADPLSYEVLRDGKVLVPATEIGLCLDGKCLAKGAALREVVPVASGAATVSTPVYKKGEVSLRRDEKLADFGDFSVRLVDRKSVV